MNGTTRVERLRHLGYDWLDVPAKHPLHGFVSATMAGSLLYVAGQVPVRPDGSIVNGKVGQDLTTSEAAAAAALCVVNSLYAAGAVVDDPEDLRRVVDLLVFVNVAPGYNGMSQVANGATKFLIDVFGETNGSHTRTAVGVAALPLDAAVEIKVVYML